MKRDEVYPSKTLKAEDLMGKDLTLRIQSVTIEKLGDEQKPVCQFNGCDKGLVLNQTNWQSIEDLYGEESDDWIGKAITLYPTKTMYGNKRVPCIRIRDSVPAPKNGVKKLTTPTGPIRPREPGEDDVEDDIDF